MAYLQSVYVGLSAANDSALELAIRIQLAAASVGHPAMPSVVCWIACILMTVLLLS